MYLHNLYNYIFLFQNTFFKKILAVPIDYFKKKLLVDGKEPLRSQQNLVILLSEMNPILLN